jgi:hypothetical protein
LGFWVGAERVEGLEGDQVGSDFGFDAAEAAQLKLVVNEAID